jgi:hypothetical protein
MGNYLSLLGETVNLLKACTSDATLEDAIILLCVYIKRFIVDRWLGLRCMGRGGWILGERGLGFVARWGGGCGGSRRVVICWGRRTIVIAIDVRGCWMGMVSEGLGWSREHTMILVLDDFMVVGEWLVLRRKWIGGMKELIDSILHDWSVAHLTVTARAWPNPILPFFLYNLSSRALLPLFPFPSNGYKTVRPLPPSSLPLRWLSQSKSLKVADLKEICSRANIPTTTRSTKADLITKILASQPAIDAYNAKYQQNENAAPPSKHDNIVSGIASKSRVALITRL